MPGTTELETADDPVFDATLERPDGVPEVGDDPIVEPDPNGSGAALVTRLSTPIVEFFTPAGLKKFVEAAWPPILGVVAFLGLWAVLAPLVDTQLGQLPGPVEVLDAGRGLWEQYRAVESEEAAFYADQAARNAELAEAGQPTQDFEFDDSKTIVAQIWTSLRTVALGFLIGTFIAVPVGLLAGLSRTFQRAINPLVQLFKPVSPLAWLPIVQLVIAASVDPADPLLPISFVVSALVVTLNSLWPTLINTAVGASSVDKDLLNVAEVLRLGPVTKLRKIILPTAMPYIFTGMRLSLGVGWMVLIAAEMLAQNPGLGKFVWDEFQNGSSQSLSRIMFAVIVIGVIGVVLDQFMARLETFASRNRAV